MKEDKDKIESSVCEACEVSIEDIHNKDTKHKVSLARAIIWYILHYEYRWSIATISKEYSRTERNIKYMIAKVRNYITFDKATNKLYYKIRSSILR